MPKKEYEAYLESLTAPDPARRRLVQDGNMGLIALEKNQFTYSPDVGYAFEVAALAEEETGRRLFFIRIDSWDPKYRAEAEPGSIDYCIPMAYDGATELERLKWTIPFGGAWSDTSEEALLVFDASWAEWFRQVKTGLAFANPGSQSAALMQLGERELGPIKTFCEA